jgi:curli production assembly/transport component CsgF
MQMNKKILTVMTAAAMGILGSATAAFASQLVYHPADPTFGGNPLNGSYLLSQAQAQGNGVNSGSQGPDLSGLTNALSGIGSGTSPIVVIGGSGSTGTGTGSTGTGTGTTTTTNAKQMMP